MTRRFLLPFVCLALVQCGDSGGPGETPPALTASIVEVIQGNGQTDTVGQQLPLPIRIVVLDTAVVSGAAGLEGVAGPPTPVPGQLVNFVVVSGGGSVFAGAALTDSAGHKATITGADEQYSNGVVHHVDALLMPAKKASGPAVGQKAGK